jgi:hypothetical protein
VEQSVDGVNAVLPLHRHEFAQEIGPKLLDWNRRVDERPGGASGLRALDISAKHPDGNWSVVFMTRWRNAGVASLGVFYLLCRVARASWLVFVDAETVEIIR